MILNPGSSGESSGVSKAYVDDLVQRLTKYATGGKTICSFSLTQICLTRIPL